MEKHLPIPWIYQFFINLLYCKIGDLFDMHSIYCKIGEKYFGNAGVKIGDIRVIVGPSLVEEHVQEASGMMRKSAYLF